MQENSVWHRRFDRVYNRSHPPQPTLPYPTLATLPYPTLATHLNLPSHPLPSSPPINSIVISTSPFTIPYGTPQGSRQHRSLLHRFTDHLNPSHPTHPLTQPTIPPSYLTNSMTTSTSYSPGVSPTSRPTSSLHRSSARPSSGC